MSFKSNLEIYGCHLDLSYGFQLSQTSFVGHFLHDFLLSKDICAVISHFSPLLDLLIYLFTVSELKKDTICEITRILSQVKEFDIVQRIVYRLGHCFGTRIQPLTE